MKELTVASRHIGTFLATEDQDPERAIRLSVDALQTIADNVNSGSLPLHAEHDERRPLSLTAIPLAELRSTVTGTQGVWVEFEVDEDEVEAAGSYIGGLSVSYIANPVQPDISSGKPPLVLATDSRYFTEEMREEAQQRLSEDFAVGGGPLMQFSAIHEGVILLEFARQTLDSFPPAVLAAIFVGALSRFLHVGGAERSAFKFQITDGDRKVRAQLRTSDVESLREAVQALRSEVERSPVAQLLEFDEEVRTWRIVHSDPREDGGGGPVER
jgi:hypothetical protein